MRKKEEALKLFLERKKERKNLMLRPKQILHCEKEAEF